ncbi:AbrB/MazE/SpoVT family DNA-binding domain-containing protein [Geomobilimonas luticola]|uniref:AbrB/MazE/SpoVT family DNA-binding domain-containing protein n=1 Tax=Geomobilimonas luticola TaxID=1114878 RepID=A0ABS5SD84_9BACT|nr:AbrB/MazE/SpoVT family DNA-binding domain-containing protein [Geomobilimonas luticola]MBT0653135.1 AbrB/MazE/SpoVT family DNA-binding domain-containing protein [Geomobilimonas luticola]
MEAVKISPKFQVVIPRDVREKLRLVAGQTMQVVAYGNRIELIPEREITEMRGFLKGIDVTVERESDRL